MKDYDKELRDAVQRFRNTPPGTLSNVAEGRAWIAVSKAIDNVKGKPTAVEVESRLGRALVVFKTALAQYIGRSAVDEMQADLDKVEAKIEGKNSETTSQDAR